jgi:dipeptidyl-peptidase-4
LALFCETVEEVLSQDNAIWIANSGARMVFASFDDRQVDHMEFSVYGEPGSVQDQYPVTNAIRYPKVRSDRSSLFCPLC